MGPYFRIGLDCLIGQVPVGELSPDTIEIHGKVLDRDGNSVSDALLELWGANEFGVYAGALPNSSGKPAGFHRVATDPDGNFSLALKKPGATPIGDGRLQAPHMLVLVFARGLLRHLITRVYFEHEAANAVDPVLLTIPEERRHTLVARSDADCPQAFQWNVILQGDNETVFFAW